MYGSIIVTMGSKVLRGGVDDIVDGMDELLKLATEQYGTLLMDEFATIKRSTRDERKRVEIRAGFINDVAYRIECHLYND